LTFGAAGALTVNITKIADCNTPSPNGGALCPFYAPSIDGGVVGFVAQNYRAVVKYAGGSLQLVADTSTPVPGGSGSFYQFESNVSVSGTKVGFENYGGPSYFAILGFYRGDGATVDVVADRSTLFPGGTTFHGFGGQFTFALDGAQEYRVLG